MGEEKNMLAAMIHGFLLAVGLILPLGVQNLFVFTQGATRKSFLSVFPVIITTAICDTLLITLAVLGISIIVLSFEWIQPVLVIGGFIFLLYMGLLSWKDRGEHNSKDANNSLNNVYRLIGFTAMISILNPHAILDTIGVIGTSSLSYYGDEKVIFTFTCIFVSWIWFFSLAAAGRLMGTRIKSNKGIKYLNKVSAVIMWGAGFYLITTI
jgi:L-lysine exporter family protein LysE/ArgO